MKVLLLGGAGHVGTFITPYLQKHHELRVLDVRPPRHDGVEYVEGSVSDPDVLRAALTGVDAFIWLVMRKPQGGSVRDQDIPTIVENYEVNTKALHLTLFIAQELGVMRGVYTSSMSVHYRMRERFEQEEIGPARHADGLRPEQGVRRADLPVLRPLVGHEPDRPADHRPAHPRAVPGRARGAARPDDRQAAVRHRRGGPGERLPRRRSTRSRPGTAASTRSSSPATSTSRTTTSRRRSASSAGSRARTGSPSRRPGVL